MLGSEAVTRINQGLGFKLAGNTLETAIFAALQEAQDDLEMGKTLPKFLLQEDQTLLLLANTHTVALPAGFARGDLDNPLHYTQSGQDKFTWLQPKAIYRDAVEAYSRTDFNTSGFKVYVIRQSTVEFVISATTNTIFTWNYYKYADALQLNQANQWLSHKSAKWWLVGEAGYRIALDARDQTAQAIFDTMRQKGRAATFGDQLAQEDQSGPYVMGADL